MRIFVAGASGLVGRGVVRALVRAGHSVTGLARSKVGERVVTDAGAVPLRGDLEDDATYQRMRDFDALVHCAQGDFSAKRLSTAQVAKLGQTDARWLRRMLEAGKGRASHFLYTSGAWVYGDTGADVAREDRPLSPMAVCPFKVDSERLCLEGARELGYKSCSVFRPGTVYGPAGPFQKFWLDAALAGKSAKYIGSGDQLTTLVHYDDLGAAYAKALERASGFEAFNVGDDEAATPKQYLGYLAELLGAKKPSGAPTFVVSLVAGHIAKALASSVRIDSTKAKEHLGWRPQYPNHRAGLKALVESVQGVANAPASARAAL